MTGPQNPSRRRFLAGLGTAATVSIAGCAGVTGDLEFSAGAVAVPQPALDSTGYEQFRVTTPVITRTVEALGMTREVRVTNTVAEYDKAVDLTGLGLGRYRAAVFAALSTPQIDVLGQTFNPVGEMSADELVGLVQKHYSNLRNVRDVGEWQVPVAGETTTVGRFEGTAELAEAGVTVDLALYVSEAVSAGSDFVVTVAAHPLVLDESAEVRTLMEAVTHAPPQ